MSELKPCPFCGTTPEKVYKSTGQTTQIVCPKCRAQFPKSTNENAFDAAWNRRAAKTCRMLLGTRYWQCSECNARIAVEHSNGAMVVPGFCRSCGAKVVG